MAVAMAVAIATATGIRPQAFGHRHCRSYSHTLLCGGEESLYDLYRAESLSLFSVKKRRVSSLYIGDAGSLLSRKEESLCSLYIGRETLCYRENKSLYSSERRVWLGQWLRLWLRLWMWLRQWMWLRLWLWLLCNDHSHYHRHRHSHNHTLRPVGEESPYSLYRG